MRQNMKMILRALLFSIIICYVKTHAQAPDILWEKPIKVDSAALHLQRSPAAFERILYTHDGHFLLGGADMNYGKYVTIAMADSNCDALWYKVFEFSPSDYTCMFDMAEGADSTFVIACKKDSGSIGIDLLNSKGVVVNERKLEFLLPDVPTVYLDKPNPVVHCVTALREGGYIITCTVFDNISWYSRMVFIKINAQGETTWIKYQKGGIPYHLVEGENGRLCFTGVTKAPQSSLSSTPMYGILSKEGDSIYSRIITSSEYPYNKSLDCAFQIRPNEFLLDGKWNVGDGNDILLIDIDSAGNMLRQRFLGVNDGQNSNSIHTFAIIPGEPHILYVKTDQYLFKMNDSLKVLWSMFSNWALDFCIDNKLNKYLLRSYSANFKSSTLSKVGMNYPPYFTTTSSDLDHQVEVCTEYKDTVFARDSFPGDTLKYRFINKAPNGLIVDSMQGILKWVPSFTDTGTYPVNLLVKDRRDQSDTISFTLKVSVNKEKVFIKTPSVDTLLLPSRDIQSFSLSPRLGCIYNYRIEWLRDSNFIGWGDSIKIRMDSTVYKNGSRIWARVITGTDTLYSKAWTLLFSSNSRIFPDKYAGDANKHIVISNRGIPFVDFELPEKINRFSQTKLQIINLKGDVITSVIPKVEKSMTFIKIDGKLRKGTYLCILKINSESFVKKFVVLY